MNDSQSAFRLNVDEVLLMKFCCLSCLLLVAAIATALGALCPYLYIVYCFEILTPFMGIHLHLFFYACLRLWFPDVETNPGPRRPVPAVCRILCSNVLGLSRNLSDLSVASSQYDILLCSETLVSDMRHVSELLVPGSSCLRSKARLH